MKLLGKMHYSPRYILELRQEAIKRRIWFSQEDLKFFKEQRIMREKQEEIKRQKDEQEKIERERKELEKAVKEEERRLKELERKRKQMLQPYKDQYNELRKFAKREDREELNSGMRLSTQYRKKFLKNIYALYEKEEIILDEDIRIILNTMYGHTDFITIKSIKMIIINEGRKNGFKGAEVVVKELMDIVSKPEILDALTEYRRWLKQQIRYHEVKQLQEQGFSKDQISRKLNITTAEVIVFGDRAKNSKEVFKKDKILFLE